MKNNVHFWNILMVAIIAVLVDYTVYITGCKHKIATIIISILVFSIYIVLLKKKKIKLSKDFEILDLIFITIIIGTAIIEIPKPDFSYDVRNYHIYLQENIKTDKINFDFFTANAIQGFLFPLGDRMYYLFRTFLGYRLGTILSYYTIIVIYYQTKGIFKHFFGEHKLIPICAILCFASSILRQWMGTYYIDSLSVVFLLEIISQVLKGKVLKDRKNLFMVALTAGIAIGIKVTNLLLLIPIGIYVIVRERKNFNKTKILDIFLGIIIFCIPFLLYIIDNIIQTGSALFPYYNNLFKSQYFGNYSWKDHRFGIPSIVHAIIWPIYTSSIKLGYGDNWIVADYIWAIGYIVNIISTIYCIVKKKMKSELFSINIISLSLTCIWIIGLEGYMRYALIIPVMYSVIIGYIILNKTKNIRFNIAPFIETLGVLIVMMIMTIKIIPEIDSFMIENISRMFKDKEKTIQIDGVWGVANDNSALTELVREEGTPIYNLETKNISESNIAAEKYNDKIENTDIYFLSESTEIKDDFESKGFKVEFVTQYTTEEIPYIYYGRMNLYKMRKAN